MTRLATCFSLLLAYAVLTLWVPGRWAWGLFQFMVFAAAAGWAVRQTRSPQPVERSLWLVPLGAATVWGLAQLAAGRTVYRWETWNAALNWATWLTLFFLAMQVFRRSAVRHAFLRWTLYFGFALAVLSTAQMFTSGGKVFWVFPSGYDNQVLGPFVYHNEYAAFMEMILPVALWMAFRDPRRTLAGCVMAGVIFASVVAAASRAGSVILCLEAATLLLVAAARRIIPPAVVVRAGAVLALSAILFAAAMGFDPLWQRFRNWNHYGGRSQYFLSSVAMVRDRPGMGFGLGNWPHVYPRYALFDDGVEVTQAHDDWAQWAAEGGLPFLLILLTLAALTVRAALRSLWGAGLLAIWIHCSVDYIFHQRPGLGACFFVLLGVLAMEAKARRAARAVPDQSDVRRFAAVA